MAATINPFPTGIDNSLDNGSIDCTLGHTQSDQQNRAIAVSQPSLRARSNNFQTFCTQMMDWDTKKEGQRTQKTKPEMDKRLLFSGYIN